MLVAHLMAHKYSTLESMTANLTSNEKVCVFGNFIPFLLLTSGGPQMFSENFSLYDILDASDSEGLKSRKNLDKNHTTTESEASLASAASSFMESTREKVDGVGVCVE